MNYHSQQRPFPGRRPYGDRSQQDRQPQAKVDPMARLDETDLAKLLTTWADATGKRLAADHKATTTAIRRFYAEFVGIASDCPKSGDGTIPRDVATRLKLLIPRALYALQRQSAAIPEELAKLVVQLVNHSTDARKLGEARAVFEAVLGYAINYGLRKN